MYKVADIVKEIEANAAKKGLKAVDFCALAGVADSTWSAIRNGRSTPRLQTLDKIAEAIRLYLPEPSAGCVYFLHVVGERDFVKIGHTINPVCLRLNTLQKWCPYPIKLVGAFEGLLSDEKDLHLRFDTLRTHGEWFKYTGDLKTYVENSFEDFDGEEYLTQRGAQLKQPAGHRSLGNATLRKNKDAVLAMREQGESLRNIGARFDCSYETVRLFLQDIT